jgi:hypothetical protein
MIKLTFSGWFECRLATDFDPADEPRGVSGFTYAVAGEPDLDRIIRTTPAGTVARRPGPQVGVAVRRVEIDGHEEPTHVLRGAPIVLLDRPAFEGRNGLAAEDTEEPIFPFHLLIEKENVRLRREFRDLQTNQYKFLRSTGLVPDVGVLAESGYGDPAAYTAARTAAIQAILADTAHPPTTTQRVALEARLLHLARFGVGPVPPVVGLQYHYVLEGPWVEVRDPQKKLRTAVDLGPWVVDLWAGCWDIDALCGYMKGTLLAPSNPY